MIHNLEMVNSPIVDALKHFEGFENASISKLGAGLINETFLVRTTLGQRYIVQKVNPIFDPAIHDNIVAVTTHLEHCGLIVPKLIPTIQGQPCAQLETGIFRAMTFIDGVSYDTLSSPGQAFGAGEFLGRFHSALDSLDHTFVGMRLGVHDTDAHLKRLRQALISHQKHRLFGEVEKIAVPLLARSESLEKMPTLGEKVCHGDLKINNFIFEGKNSPQNQYVVTLIDLDTLGPMQRSFELGDAFRSWCNPSGENTPDSQFSLEIFEAAIRGYTKGSKKTLKNEEKQAFLLSVEWMSLELTARFLTDTLEEKYFGFDSKTYKTRGDHNLVRAKSQWNLHKLTADSRHARAKILGL